MTDHNELDDATYKAACTWALRLVLTGLSGEGPERDTALQENLAALLDAPHRAFHNTLGALLSYLVAALETLYGDRDTAATAVANELAAALAANPDNTGQQP
ncbi:hypothetical protein BN1232_02250 [Mycobacterium lentiflavum]|uniref:Uncharacterized protein n=1 Tax=Mycobacterium lentiflavum TaxID=141349 RepID=A0A0E4CMU1_MYCLN|nr:hypothetical protein [Mycobacterium lentiflavum]CQD11929.1 hypothetical protein BN1232_02250 [Mycobacterium lentiflavum]